MDMAKKNAVIKNKMMSLPKDKASTIVAIRILIILLVDIAVGCALSTLSKLEPSEGLYFQFSVLPIVKYVCAALVLLAAVYAVIMIVKKVDTSAHIMTPLMIFAVALYLAVTAAFLDRFIAAPYLFWTMTIVVSVLFAVYYIYTILMYKK